MNQRTILLAGIVLGGLGVAIGAFGAHGLRAILTENNRIETFELAVRYQFYHAFALLITGILMQHFQPVMLRRAAWCFVLGTLIFSGSLYFLSLTNITLLGAVTPVGGIFFILGWILLIPGITKK